MNFMASRVAPDDPEIPLTREFGARVQARRKARKMSQWAVARAVRPPTTQATVSAIERGIGQSAWVFEVCRVLEMDPPVVGASGDMERWVAAGRLLQARAPKVFAYQLESMEHLGSSLAVPENAAANPEKPRHH